MSLKRILWGILGPLAFIGVAWAATATYSIGTSGGPGGQVQLFGSTSGSTTIVPTATAGSTTVTLPANTGTVGETNLAQGWTAAQTFTNSDILLLGSSTGATTFTSANAGASNFTLTVPAVTDTLAVLGTSQTFTATQTFSGTFNASGTFEDAGNTMTFPGTAATLAGLGVNQAWTAGQAVTPDTATSCGTITTGGTATPNLANSNSCQLTFGTGASATMTIANPSGIKIGQDYLITIAQNTSGSGTVSWGTDFDFGTAGTPTLTTTASKIDEVMCYAYAASGTGALHCRLAGAGF